MIYHRVERVKRRMSASLTSLLRVRWQHLPAPTRQGWGDGSQTPLLGHSLAPVRE